MERTQLDTETDNCIQYDSAKIDEIMYEKVIDSIGNSTKCIKFNKFSIKLQIFVLCIQADENKIVCLINVLLSKNLHLSFFFD